MCTSEIVRFYQKPALTTAKKLELLTKLQEKCGRIVEIDVELCYHIEINNSLSDNDWKILQWILSHPFNPNNLRKSTHFVNSLDGIVEFGPRFNFSTANSTNAVSICHSLGLKQVCRLEISRRYSFGKLKLSQNDEMVIFPLLHDRMTECQYTKINLPKKSFDENLIKNEDINEINVLQQGEEALKKINCDMGLAFDEADLIYYTNLFKNILKRNPTNIECFDLAQSNSEHSRHWFFKGKMIIDGKEYDQSLIDMIMNTQKHSNNNNVIKFSDNSSAIKGYKVKALRPTNAGSVSELKSVDNEFHLIFTAETHNFPTGVAPFSGATTGTGGRIRDIQCVGRGGHCIAGTAGYSVGNLNIPGYSLPWENPDWHYPTEKFASPLEILIEASNGASDYGNKFGEPLICGFARTFGSFDAYNERREWIKPIMFSGGIGTMEANMVEKLPPKSHQQIVKIGGPVYRIGVGGGSASSVEIQGDNKSELDFNAVQRGDAEMEQKLNRVVRTCLELNDNNPIISIHDQGAGGNGNVLKELVEPVGGIIYANRFDLGDPTINTIELWGAEYQESNALLCSKDNIDLLKKICKRERCPVNVVGEVMNTGRVVLALDETKTSTPFDLELEMVLGKMPQKTFRMQRRTPLLKEIVLPDGLSIYKALERVLRLPSVASKRYLTNKVDRCVTGLIAQQQCVGPIHTPLADMAVTAVSHFSYHGIASSIGEQPIKGLINPKAGARLTVAEALSNLVFALITDIKDIKCSGNWMWAAKLPGEGPQLYDACEAMCDLMSQLGIAIDGGKDSLSMAARCNNEIVSSPGTLVISTYAPCPDVRKKVTPDLKAPAMNKTGVLLFVDLSNGHNRLGGSALGQVFGQLGNESPDVENVENLKNAFNATQQLIKDGAILSGHDVSDGGLITCLLEMCFAGLSGIEVALNHRNGNVLQILFSEEVGWVLEVLENDSIHCLKVFQQYKVPVYKIGKSVGCGVKSDIIININSACIESTVLSLMRMWEDTSYQLESLQTLKKCAKSEFESLSQRCHPNYYLTFDPDEELSIDSNISIKVAVLREEGTNGDREMAAALIHVGFQVFDVTMEDLLNETISLENFRGIIFPGGFSYADVLGSAKGWAGCILFNDKLKKQFQQFYHRSDTFSLGVCNGCQLMSLMGWIGSPVISSDTIPDILLEHNESERFECRWTNVKIEKSKSIMLDGMDGSFMGVWIAHGEGRFDFKNQQIYKNLVKNNCICLRYTDDHGQPTEIYPMNPNGSIEGLAGVCSLDGRHLAMMPHPERCVQLYQWPYISPNMNHYQKSPWEKMFSNALQWCLKN